VEEDARWGKAGKHESHTIVLRSLASTCAVSLVWRHEEALLHHDA
jgi:hypothetical protein